MVWLEWSLTFSWTFLNPPTSLWRFLGCLLTILCNYRGPCNYMQKIFELEYNVQNFSVFGTFSIYYYLDSNFWRYSLIFLQVYQNFLQLTNIFSGFIVVHFVNYKLELYSWIWHYSEYTQCYHFFFCFWKLEGSKAPKQPNRQTN